MGWTDSKPKEEKQGQNKKTTENDSSAPKRINFMKYDQGLELAKKERKKVFVEFTAKWCGWCKKMHSSTFIDPDIVKMMDEHYVAVSVDGDSRDTLNIDGWITSERALARQFKIRSYPTYWFLTSDAEPIAPVKGYRDKKSLGDILDYLKDDVYKTVDFKAFLESKKDK
jgi:thioredoxin-related protein